MEDPSSMPAQAARRTQTPWFKPDGTRLRGNGIGVEQQDSVNRYFEDVAAYWTRVYERRDDLWSTIFQERLLVVLGLVDRLGLPPGAHALEIGCGAGYATVGLAKRGFDVDAVDAVQVMVDSTRDRAIKEGVKERIRSSLGDVRALAFPDETFSLAIAIGVLPWLASMREPVQEMCRILRPGGYLIVSVENCWGLRQFLDPIANPLFRPVKEVTKAVLRRFHWLKPGVRARRSLISGCDAVLKANGLEKLEGITLGFGPFMFFGHEYLPYSLGLRVHRRLQSLAYRGVPFIRSRGAEYIVLARKPDIGPSRRHQLLDNHSPERTENDAIWRRRAAPGGG